MDDEIVLKRLRLIDWEDLDQGAPAICSLLEDICKDISYMSFLLNRVADDEELSALCEVYDVLDKIVVLDDRESRARVRFHLFKAGTFDRPHNHRWTYGSRILAGRYDHVIFGESSGWGADSRVSDIRPKFVQSNGEGATYVLHHELIHSARAPVDTITLILRGPPASSDFFVGGRESGQLWRQTGRELESSAEKEAKRMSPRRLAELTSHIKEQISI